MTTAAEERETLVQDLMNTRAGWTREQAEALLTLVFSALARRGYTTGVPLAEDERLRQVQVLRGQGEAP